MADQNIYFDRNPNFQSDVLQERAVGSWQRLRHFLDQDPADIIVHENAGVELLSHRGPVELADQTYGLAASNLAHLLQQHENAEIGPKVLQFAPRRYGPAQSPHAPAVIPTALNEVNPARLVSHPFPPGEVPTPEEVLPLLQNQSALLQQLELENNHLREEITVARTKMQRVTEENRLLHLALQRTVTEEIFGGNGILMPSESDMQHETGIPARTEKLMKKQDYQKWQDELIRMKAFYTSKAERLETELQLAREEIVRKDHDIEIITQRLQNKPTSDVMYGNTDGNFRGLCLRCARNEALLPAPLDTQESLASAQLRRERDDALEHLEMYKQRLQEQQSREEEAYQQAKKGIEMTEASQFELTHVIIEREQLKEEVKELKQRIEETIADTQKKLVLERESARRESDIERNELNEKLKELGEQLAKTQTSLERESRQRLDLLAEVEMLKVQLDNIDQEYSKATSTIKLHMVNTAQERDSAIEELKKMKKELHKKDRAREQKMLQEETELENVKRRLKQAEEELIEAKEQCIFAFERSKTMEREVHLAQLARESIEKSRNDDIRLLGKEMEERVMQLNGIIQSQDEKYASQMKSIGEALESHRNLAKKLHAECNRLAQQLEVSSSKHRAEIRNLKTENKELKNRLQRSTQRSKEFEDQNGHYGRVMNELRDRLKQLDNHSKHSSQQVLELLTKQTKLMRDRHVLAKEVEFLREELIRGKRTNIPTMDNVEIILNDVKMERDWAVAPNDKRPMSDSETELDGLTKLSTNEKGHNVFTSTFDNVPEKP